MSETGAGESNNIKEEAAAGSIVTIADETTTTTTTGSSSEAGAGESGSATGNNNASLADDSLAEGGGGTADELDTSNMEVEPDGERIITLGDVLNEQKEMDMEYAAVLGGSDFKSCTYAEVCCVIFIIICSPLKKTSTFSIPQGYVKRQALYACLTCMPEARTDAKQRAGVCLACSYSCHSGHDLIELYTKRAFRCDCGTSRILAIRCRLDEQKPDFNSANRYNHNFSGVYCTCGRPYPDPEDPVDDEMIQCVVCEDWYHCRHLGVPPERVPSTGDFSEMICGACMQRNEFLQHYLAFTVNAEADAEAVAETTEEKVTKEPAADEEKSVVDVEALPAVADDKKSASTSSDTASKDGQFTDEINQCIQDIIEINKSDLGDDGTAPDGTAPDGTVPLADDATAEPANADAQPAAKKQKLNDASEKITAVAPSTSHEEDTAAGPAADPTACRKPRLPRATAESAGPATATFWPDGWRARLCACAVCVLQLQRKRVEFLLDPEDTVRRYEEKGMAKMVQRKQDGEPMPEDDVAMTAWSRLDHVGQVDVISGYNKLKEKLVEFLRSFVVNDQVVTEEDIKRFFRMMREGGGGAAEN